MQEMIFLTTLTNRPATALLVVDVQNDVMGESVNSPAVIANIAALVAKVRSADTSIVWIQHSDAGLVEGSEGWNYVPQLQRTETEPLIHKKYGDSFEGTNLEDVLASLGVGKLIVAGAQTDMCIRSTIHGAFTRGYDVTLVSDAHTTCDLTEWGAPAPESVIAHTNLYWENQQAPGRTATITETATVDFAP